MVLHARIALAVDTLVILHVRWLIVTISAGVTYPPTPAPVPIVEIITSTCLSQHLSWLILRSLTLPAAAKP
jgi:hypothetical protein